MGAELSVDRVVRVLRDRDMVMEMGARDTGDHTDHYVAQRRLHTVDQKAGDMKEAAILLLLIAGAIGIMSHGHHTPWIAPLCATAVAVCIISALVLMIKQEGDT